MHLASAEPIATIGRFVEAAQDAGGALLRFTHPETDGEPDACPGCVYVVHDGTIYEGRSSDGGTTFHGYPYRGKPVSRTVRELRAMARRDGCPDAFEHRVTEHIVLHGSGRHG